MFVLDLKDVIIAGIVDDVANSPDWHFESDVFERSRECFAFDPAPIAAQIAGAVLGINLGHAIELGATGQFAEHFFSHRFLCHGIPGIGVAGNHDHAQLDLLLGSEFVAVFFVVVFYLGR